MHIAREVLCCQLSKLGLIIPEIGLPAEFKRVLQTIWANNGDTISKQYAGTNALKVWNTKCLQLFRDRGYMVCLL